MYNACLYVICWSCFICFGKQCSCHLLDECEVKGRSGAMGLRVMVVVVMVYSGNMSCGLRRVVGEHVQARLCSDCIHVHGWNCGGTVVISVYLLMMQGRWVLIFLRICEREILVWEPTISSGCTQVHAASIFRTLYLWRAQWGIGLFGIYSSSLDCPNE